MESKARRNGELKIQQEVEAILSRLPRAAGGEEQSFSEPKPEKTVTAERRAPERSCSEGGSQGRWLQQGRFQGQRHVLAAETFESSGASF